MPTTTTTDDDLMPSQQDNLLNTILNLPAIIPGQSDGAQAPWESDETMPSQTNDLINTFLNLAAINAAQPGIFDSGILNLPPQKTDGERFKAASAAPPGPVVQTGITTANTSQDAAPASNATAALPTQPNGLLNTFLNLPPANPSQPGDAQLPWGSGDLMQSQSENLANTFLNPLAINPAQPWTLSGGFLNQPPPQQNADDWILTSAAAAEPKGTAPPDQFLSMDPDKMFPMPTAINTPEDVSAADDAINARYNYVLQVYGDNPDAVAQATANRRAQWDELTKKADAAGLHFSALRSDDEILADKVQKAKMTPEDIQALMPGVWGDKGAQAVADIENAIAAVAGDAANPENLVYAAMGEPAAPAVTAMSLMHVAGQTAGGVKKMIEGQPGGGEELAEGVLGGAVGFLPSALDRGEPVMTQEQADANRAAVLASLPPRFVAARDAKRTASGAPTAPAGTSGQIGANLPLTQAGVHTLWPSGSALVPGRAELPLRPDFSQNLSAQNLPKPSEPTAIKPTQSANAEQYSSPAQDATVPPAPVTSQMSKPKGRAAANVPSLAAPKSNVGGMTQPIQVTGSFNGNLGAARDWAYKTMPSHVINSATGIQINIARQGLDKTLSRLVVQGFTSAVDHIDATRVIPRLLENATPVDQRPAPKPSDNTGTTRQFQSHVVVNGRPYTTRIFVKEHMDPSGKRFYTFKSMQLENGIPGGQ